MRYLKAGERKLFAAPRLEFAIETEYRQDVGGVGGLVVRVAALGAFEQVLHGVDTSNAISSPHCANCMAHRD